jgi:hypothetical protein
LGGAPQRETRFCFDLFPCKNVFNLEIRQYSYGFKPFLQEKIYNSKAVINLKSGSFVLDKAKDHGIQQRYRGLFGKQGIFKRLITMPHRPWAVLFLV